MIRVVLLLTLLVTLTSSTSAATGTGTKPTSSKSKSTLAETCAQQLKTPHAFRDLVSWVSSFPKYQVSGVEIRTGEDGDRGFFASREIPADDLLIRLPDSLFVHPGTMFNTPYWSQRWDIFQHAQLDNYTSMALRLFHEAYDYHEGSSSPVGDVPSGSCSPWLPWLRILPESFSTPPYMDESDFALMEELTPNSGHADTLRDLKSELESTYEHVITEIYDAYPELFKRRPTWEEFLRFHQAIQTRCWTNTTSVPFLEMFNHDGHANIPYFGEDDVTIHSHRMYAPGEQLYISYGQQSDWFTLLYYGFVSDRNPWNTRKFDVNLQLAMFPHLIAAHDLSPELHFGDEGDYLPNNTLAVMRLYVLTQQDFIHHHKIHGDGILSIENEVTMLRALMEICNEQLSQHSTTIAEDEIRMKDPSLSYASRMIIHYVIKQKRLLENVKQEIQKRWMNLLEYEV